MPKVLFVCLHRPDRSPSQRFRFEQYIGYLEKNGFSCTFSYLLNAEDDKLFYAGGRLFSKASILLKSIRKRVLEVFFKSYDIVFVQRECFMLGTAFFEKRFSKKAKLIFDFDDSIWLQNVSEANKHLGFLKNADKTKDIIQVAYLVLAGNRYLADYALQFNSNVHIFPTTIDTEKYQLRTVSENRAVCIGWSGSFSTIQHFEHALGALLKIKMKYGDRVVFKVIGDPNYKNDSLHIKGIGWRSATEVADLQSLDIGIMPLPDDEWAKGKCGLKGLQYMALGVPAVMSPVGVNTEIIKDGVNGFLATTEEEWVDKLSRLVDSGALRRQFSIQGRKTVEENYSVAANWKRYVEVFNSVASGKNKKLAETSAQTMP